MDIPILAGTISTVAFAVSNLPMLRKALRTRDVSSYSLSSMAMINAANVVYSLYVFSLPIGPIWALHTFYLVSCGIMLVLCVRDRRAPAHRPATDPVDDSLGDPEPALLDRVAFLDVEIANDGAGRALREPVEHRGDGPLIALDLGFDRAVGAIAHPAAHSEPPRLGAGREAEAHALHVAVHDHVSAHHPLSVFVRRASRRALGG